MEWTMKKCFGMIEYRVKIGVLLPSFVFNWSFWHSKEIKCRHQFCLYDFLEYVFCLLCALYLYFRRHIQIQIQISTKRQFHSKNRFARLVHLWDCEVGPSLMRKMSQVSAWLHLTQGSPFIRKVLFKRKSAVRGGLKTHSKWNVGVLQWI